MIHRFDDSLKSLFTFIIIALFVFSVLLLVIAGIKSYRSVTDLEENNSQLRSTLSYISNKLTSCDTQNTVSIEETGKKQVLKIRKIIQNDEYYDCIYCENGALYEQLIAKGDSLNLDSGNFITKIAEARIKQESLNLLKITAKTKNGTQKETFLHLQSGE